MEPENEIENAYTLERQRFLEEERIRRSQAETQGKILEAEYVAQNKQPPGTISKTTFFLMLSIAIICDIVIALIALLPYVGWVINWILSPCVFLLFFTWYKIKGMRYTSMRKMAVLPAGLLIEMIPYINILPGWTVSVILNTQGDKINKLASPISAMKNSQTSKTPQTPAPPINPEIQARQAAKQKTSVQNISNTPEGSYKEGKLTFPKTESENTPTTEQNTQKSISADDGFKQMPARDFSENKNYHFAERRERELARRNERRKAA